MGLDLVCDHINADMTYSHVQTMRKNWILAYAQWTDNPQLAHNLRQCVDDNHEIDYCTIETIVEEAHDTCQVLVGLYDFVCHSDSDGEWSCWQAQRILHTLHILSSILQEICPYDFYEDDNKHMLEEILEYSSQSHQSILFC